ncbi:zinc finger, CCHC-type containing protein [Tanacetum coccineum]
MNTDDAIQDSDKPKGNNVAGPSVVNMVEHNNSSRYNDNKGKRKHHDNTMADPKKKVKPTCWKCGKTGHIKRHCKGVNVGNKANGLGTKDDDVVFCYVYLLHTKDEALDKFKVFKIEVELQQGSLIKKFRTDRGDKRGIECIFVGYAEHSKAFRFYVIKLNDSVLVNSIIESRDAIFDENRFSSVPRPSLKIPNKTEDIGGSVVPEEMDLKKAFLNGELDEEVYMNQRQGFIMPGNENKVCKLIKSLYGLKKFDESGKGVIICPYVDDMLIFGTDQVQVDLTKEFLSSRFSMEDTGEADVILGIRIKHESNGIAISQSHYIEKVLKKFNYFDYTPVSTPMDTSEKIMPNNAQTVSQLEYSRAIGCLMYAITCTSPDIAFAVGKLSRYTSNHGTRHWQAIQRVFLLGGGAIYYASKKQTCITGLTMESEFVALTVVGKEANCQMYNGKSRHLGVRHSMIRELITNVVISIEFVRSQQNLVDHLTKRLAGDLVIKSAEGMGLNLDEDDSFTNFETEYPAIVFDDTITSDAALSCEPTVSPLNENEIDFRISFDESDNEDYMVIFDENSFSYKIISVDNLKMDSKNENDKVNMPSSPSSEPTVHYFDDLDFFKDFENEFLTITYNNDLTEPSVNMAPLPLRDQRHLWLRYQVEGCTEDIMHNYDQRLKIIFGRHAEGRKSGARLSGGHFIGRLAAYFGLVSDQGLRGLSMVTRELSFIDLLELSRLNICERIGDTWAWVALRPERQPNDTASALEAADDAPAGR